MSRCCKELPLKSVETWRKLWNTSRLNHFAWLETGTVTKAYHMKFYTKQSYSYRLSHTSWTTPLSVILAMPHRDGFQFAKEIWYSPLSVIWQPHRLLELKIEKANEKLFSSSCQFKLRITNSTTIYIEHK